MNPSGFEQLLGGMKSPLRGRGNLLPAGRPDTQARCASAPRARPRRTPARDIAGSGSVPDRIEERSLVGREDAPASHL